jgi:hypothetical protein
LSAQAMEFEVTRRPKSIHPISLIAGFFILSSCVWTSMAVREYSGPMLREKPEDLFRLLIEDPIPQSVKYLQAAGDSWEGFSVYMRFEASDLFIEDYTSAKFEAVQCYLIDSKMALHSHEYDIFVPSWAPNKVLHPRCYQSRGEVGVKWIGMQYLVVDYYTVFLHAIGDSM